MSRKRFRDSECSHPIQESKVNILTGYDITLLIVFRSIHVQNYLPYGGPKSTYIVCFPHSCSLENQALPMPNSRYFAKSLYIAIYVGPGPIQNVDTSVFRTLCRDPIQASLKCIHSFFLRSLRGL